MKKTLLFGITAALLALVTFSVHAQNAANMPISNIKVTTEYLETPQISVSGLKNDSRSVKGGTYRWLVINVGFTPVAGKPAKTAETEWLDDLSVEAMALVPTIYGGKSVSALLTGTQKLWSVPLDGLHHNARLVIPPVIFARYYRGSEKMTKAYKEIPILIKFKAKDQRVIGVGVYAPRKTSESTVFKLIDGADKALGVLKVPDSIFPVQKTPWAYVEYDSLEMPQTQEGK